MNWTNDKIFEHIWKLRKLYSLTLLCMQYMVYTAVSAYQQSHFITWHFSQCSWVSRTWAIIEVDIQWVMLTLTCLSTHYLCYTYASTHTTHTHMTIHSVGGDCPLLCSRQGTWGYCWATVGGQCWPRPASEGDPHIPHTAVMLHDWLSIYQLWITYDLTIFMMSGCGLSQLMHQNRALTC